MSEQVKGILPLVNGGETVVDAGDLAYLSQWEWRATTRAHRSQQYATRREGRKTRVYMHVVIMQPPLGFRVDHINGDGLDNRRSNLRLCTSNQNCTNTKMYSNNTSGYRGLTWFKPRGQWLVQIQHLGKKHRLGYFDKGQEVWAAKVYDEAARRLHGEFATCNFQEAQNG